MPANLTTKLGQLVDVLTPDTTNTRIGVANASPTRTLDVTGTGGFSGNLNVGGTNNVATGTIGIGVANNATVLVDGRLDANGNTYGYRFVNGSAGTGATTLAVLTNGTHALQQTMFGTAWTTSGMNRQGGGMVLCDGPGGLTLNTQASQPIYFGINSTEVARFDTSGNLLVGTTSTVNTSFGAAKMTVAGSISSMAGISHSVTAGSTQNIFTIGSYGAQTQGILTVNQAVSTGATIVTSFYIMVIGGGDAPSSGYASAITQLGQQSYAAYLGGGATPTAAWTQSGGTATFTIKNNGANTCTVTWQYVAFSGSLPTAV